MLQQKPEDKNDGAPWQTWEVTMRFPLPRMFDDIILDMYKLLEASTGPTPVQHNKKKQVSNTYCVSL